MPDYERGSVLTVCRARVSPRHRAVCEFLVASGDGDDWREAVSGHPLVIKLISKDDSRIAPPLFDRRLAFRGNLVCDVVKSISQRLVASVVKGAIRDVRLCARSHRIRFLLEGYRPRVVSVIAGAFRSTEQFQE